MGWEIKIGISAKAEIDEAIHWYREKSNLAASKLMSDLANRLNALELNPFYTKRYKNIYCLPLRKFPYMLHFEVEEGTKEIRILGLLHTSLNPKKHWK